ncbi:MAG TPA: ribosome biogenesis factor YjgA [Polyangiaceae bacterium]|jgi:ribosome-associated protein|nr:ribosome biogenesis factor YjgA [Polyangiaceae bacterium]
MALPPRRELNGEPAPEEEEDLRSRSDARRERKQSEEALMNLAKALVELPARTLERLKLPEQVQDVVDRARLVPGGGPKNRALRLVRIALRDGDGVGIAQALEDVHAPPRKGAPMPAPAPARETPIVVEWRGKLVEGDDAVLGEYVATYPNADRRQLRQLVRNVKKATDATRADAVKALTKALRKTTR